jgi:hypothetical protein
VIAVCTGCDRIATMTTCACGGVVAQLPGWIKRRDGRYVLDGAATATPFDERPAALAQIVATGGRWSVIVHDAWLTSDYVTAAAAVQAAVGTLTTLAKRIDDAMVDFLVENGRAEEARGAACPL